MNDMTPFQGLEVGYDIPALPGMAEGEIQTPCLVLDLDALERNIKKMGDYAKAHGMRHRVHGKMHKSVDVAKLQVELGGACGVCCQKVSEAEVFARGGIKDVLVSNQVRDPAKIDRLARCPSSARAPSAASTTWPTWPTFRRPRRSTAPRSSALWRSTAARGAAA
jgi:3-hydroxy-D-aspartate aldolase